MALTAPMRPRTEQTVLGVPLYLYHNQDSIAVYTQDGAPLAPLGILLLESNGWSIGYSLDSTGRTVDECLEQMVRNREVSLV